MDGNGWYILSRSQLKAKFFDFLEENRRILVVLSGRFQRLERDILRFVLTTTIKHIKHLTTKQDAIAKQIKSKALLVLCLIVCEIVKNLSL